MAKEDRMERRLAAILAADVVGYSQLMGVDEEGTLRRLQAFTNELLLPKIAEHRGRLFKTTGDGFLAEFTSVFDAFRCAIEIQDGLEAAGRAPASGEALRLRMGLNMGDIIVSGEDVFGDGVNIAARLEAIAPPGGICVSQRAWEDLRRLEVSFEDMGPQQLKNIADPVRAFRVERGEALPRRRAMPRGLGLASWRRWIAVALTGLVAVSLALLFWPRGESAEALIARELAAIPCSWLRIAEHVEGNGGASFTIAGAAVAPDTVAPALLRAAREAGVAIERLNTRALAPIAPAQCRWIERARPYRHAGISRIEAGSSDALGEGRSAFTLTFNPDELAPHLMLYSIDPDGTIKEVGTRGAMLDELRQGAERRPNGDYTRRLYADHSGWGGLLLMESDAPIPAEMDLAMGGDMAAIDDFDDRARADNWRFELVWLHSEGGEGEQELRQ